MDVFGLHSHTFARKEPESALGAADMLAWEWNLEHSRSLQDDRGKPPRTSFLEIMNGVKRRAYTKVGAEIAVNLIRQTIEEGLIEPADGGQGGLS